MTNEQFDAFVDLVMRLIGDHHLYRHGIRSFRETEITQGVITKARLLLVTED